MVHQHTQVMTVRSVVPSFQLAPTCVCRIADLNASIVENPSAAVVTVMADFRRGAVICGTVFHHKFS